MHRAFSANADLHQPTITITAPDEVHHLVRVLRLKKGAELCVFNGRGEEVKGRILAIAKKGIEVQIDAIPSSLASLSDVKLTLACAVPKKAKFEWIVEKTTELGVDHIIPLRTHRTEVFWDGEKGKSKQDRLLKVAANAAKQCQRRLVPHIAPQLTFKEALKIIKPGDTACIPCLTGPRQSLNQVFKDVVVLKRIIFFIGPEGDFTPDELELAKDAGCRPVSLGPLILKVDTAAVSVVAAARLWLSSGISQE
jgi:16S rRNA (uracil1498-N3)-methyltransferase